MLLWGFYWSKRVQPFTVSPLACAVSVELLAQCSCRAVPAARLALIRSIKITVCLSLGDQPQLVTAAHVERRKRTFFSFSFHAMESWSVSLRVRGSWPQFIGGELALFGPVPDFSLGIMVLVTGSFFQDQFILKEWLRVQYVCALWVFVSKK